MAPTTEATTEVPVPPGIARLPVAVLFIHGMWHGAWCWNDMARYLAERGVACFLLELPGHGARRDAEKLTWLTLDSYAREVARAAEAVRSRLPEGTRFVLAGHSLAGAVLQRVLAWQSVPVPDALVLLAPVPPAGAAGITWGLVRGGYLPAVLCSVARLSVYVLIADPDRAKALLFSPPVPRERVAGYLRDGRLGHDSFRAYAGMLLMLAGWRGRARRAQARLRAAGAPVLLLTADNDRVIPSQDARAREAAYGTGHEHRSFPLAHDLMLDEGTQASWRDVAEALFRWLERAGSSAAAAG